jgi:protein O-GlcNAc transferase
VDVLVDLAGHTAEHRLLMFARVPAPVQVAYLGYPNTTGMPRSQMHYRLTDALADPPGDADRLHTEELVRLPDVFLCYRPLDDAPPVAPCPCGTTGVVTFGSFNTLEKVTAAQIGLWAQILRRSPGSRLMLKNKSLGDAAVRERVRAAFAAHGVDGERLVLAGPEREPARHLARYNEVDVALDTFPYAGTTTTCEALWMGVPVVTLAGATHRSRVGLSLLTAVGLSELVATAPQQYVDLALAMAGDPPRLKALRETLRDRVRTSCLTDAPRFTRHLEAAYRRMWIAHCARAAGRSGAGAVDTP